MAVKETPDEAQKLEEFLCVRRDAEMCLTGEFSSVGLPCKNRLIKALVCRVPVLV
jgi:hypothetical protein